MMAAIAFSLILLFSCAADGLMDALCPVGFLLIGSVVMGAAYILIRVRVMKRNLIDALLIVFGIAAVGIAFWALMRAVRRKEGVMYYYNTTGHRLSLLERPLEPLDCWENYDSEEDGEDDAVRDRPED